MKAYVKKGLALLGEEGAARIAGFLVTYIITNNYSQGDVGLLFAGIALMGNIVNIGDLGLLPLGFTEASKPDDKREFAPHAIYQSRLTSFTVLTPIAFLILLLLPIENSLKNMYLFFTVAVFIDALSPQWFFKARQQFKITTLTSTVTATLYLTLIAIAVLVLKLPIELIPIVYLSAHIGGSLFLAFKSGFPVMPGFKNEHGTILKASLSVGAGRILQQLPTLLPPLLIVGFSSLTERITPEHAAGFGTAFRIILIMKVLDRVISTIFLSSLPKLWSENRERTTIRVQQFFTMMTILGTALGVVLIFGAPLIMQIFDETYKTYAITLAILSLFLVLTMLNSVVSYGILAIGVRNDFMRATLIPTLLFIPLLILLTWLWADRGAALGINILELGIFLFSAKYFKKQLHLSLTPLFILLSIPLLIISHYYFQSTVHTISILAGTLLFSVILLVRNNRSVPRGA